MKKFKGSALMTVTVIASAVMSSVALTTAKISQNAIRSMNSLKTATQAEQYAEAEAAIIKATSYSDLQAKSKSSIQNSNGYFSEVTLSAESNYSDTVKKREATIKIYYGNEAYPRSTLKVLKLDIVDEPGESLPVGTVIAMAANSAPDGYLLCNGAAVSRTAYAKLFAKIGTVYGSGNGSSTFNLPNLNNRFVMGSGTAGTVKSAGLPDIQGTFTGIMKGYLTVTGAFTRIEEGSTDWYGDDYTTGGKVVFKASSYNSVYGASDTVQPPALTMRYYIKY